MTSKSRLQNPQCDSEEYVQSRVGGGRSDFNAEQEKNIRQSSNGFSDINVPFSEHL